MKTVVIIPALNEEQAVGKVIQGLPPNIAIEIVVCDNGSTDRTAQVAAAAGATVISVPKRGYGNACLAGIAYFQAKNDNNMPDIVVFLDADFSDDPTDITRLIAAIVSNEADMVIGSRVTGNAARGALMPQQRFGNWLATTLIHLIYKVRFTDLGPFRAIRWQTLLALDMRDTTYGWTVEMQVKAVKQGWRTAEIPVSYRPRIGVSKVSGTLRGTVLAGYKILTTIFKLM